MAKIDPDKRYTIQEVIKLWNLKSQFSSQVIYRKIHNGELKAINIGNKKRAIYRILGNELLRYEKENQT